MNVLLLGGGGREHALAWKISQSPLVDRLWCAPGNPGTAEVAQCTALVDAADHDGVLAFCRANAVGLVVVGPEAPLEAGLVDFLTKGGVRTFGPTKAAARLETSKGFTKDLCRLNSIPTAAYEKFDDADEAKEMIRLKRAPIVVKADGLAAGKGVVVAETVEQAEEAVDRLMAGGKSVVVEEFMEGEEASFFVLSDGEHPMALASAQDHKRVDDGDTGPDTGGMGAYSPAPIMTPAMCERTMKEIVRPALRAMHAMGCPFKGVLFAGLMITADGPKLIEFNARFGDPETQVLMLRLESDLVPLLMAACDGGLERLHAAWDPAAALTVVMAAKGYPGDYAKGETIRGITPASRAPGACVFQAGTALRDGAVVSAGGRVLNVCAKGPTVGEAQRLAYAAAALIKWDGGFCRRDIGWRAVAAEAESAKA